MKRVLWFVTTLAILAPVTSLSEEVNVTNIAAGKKEFVTACASCHGQSGKGDGDLAKILEVGTPDLTTITVGFQREVELTLLRVVEVGGADPIVVYSDAVVELQRGAP